MRAVPQKLVCCFPLNSKPAIPGPNPKPYMPEADLLLQELCLSKHPRESSKSLDEASEVKAMITEKMKVEAV